MYGSNKEQHALSVSNKQLLHLKDTFKGRQEKMETTKTVTRERMIELVSARVEGHLKALESKKPNSFAYRGTYTRLVKAKLLLTRLKAGQNPTRHQVVAYAGKGARLLT